MVTKTGIDLREFGRIVNTLAIALHFFVIFLGVVTFDYYPIIVPNLLLHFCWIYGNTNYKLGLMLVPLFLWFIPAVVFIVYLITAGVYPELYANWYLIVGACLFLAIYIACILATDSTTKADRNDHSNSSHLSVLYTAGKESV